MTNPGNGHHSNKPAKEVLTTMLERVQYTIDASGSSAWVWDNRTPWNQADTSGFNGEDCDHEGKIQRYSMYLWNFSSFADPPQVVAAMKRAWEAQGWHVRTVYPWNPKQPVGGLEIAVDFPDGSGLGFGVGTRGGSIDAESECTTDPAMNETSE